MALYTQVGGVQVEAFQWQGDPLDGYELPGWARAKGFHAPSDGTLQVRCETGTFPAFPGDWVWMAPDGTIHVAKDSLFSAMFDTENAAEDPADGEPADAKASVRRGRPPASAPSTPIDKSDKKD